MGLPLGGRTDCSVEVEPCSTTWRRGEKGRKGGREEGVAQGILTSKPVSGVDQVSL